MEVRRTRRKKICAAMILQMYSSEREIQNVLMIGQTMTTLPILARAIRRNKVPRVHAFAEHTVLQYDDLDFKFHFRLQRCTVEVLLHQLGNSSIPTPENSFGGTKALTLKKQLLMFLWFAGM
ncbi:hypothetical protein HOLleu_08114 [Holothuria leucospilota]|uniref:Uncharacterized protein n=1 Tax=Holothuria leucospilota TaxID=206669 RepID=A0A9Q1HHI1_HOLLE|nr:hypothetical protein HOLleu_08114 [Holothuria leucospilota]